MVDKKNGGIFNDADSFELAKQLGIQIKYVDFPEPIYGYYAPMLFAEQIIISNKLSLEKQEKVCDHLIAHHILDESVEFCLDRDTFERFESNKKFSQYVILHKKLASMI